MQEHLTPAGTLPADGTLGGYSVRAILEFDKPQPRKPEELRPDEEPGPENDDYVAYEKSVHGSFLVAAYRRPDFRVDVSLPGGIVKATDLLNRAVFYKVGHHGSHNATLREKGLEMMTSGDLVAFIPVNEEMAKKKNWNHMPLPGLVRELERRTQGRVVRIDEDYADGVKTLGGKRRAIEGDAAKRFFAGLGKDRLFYEWSLPLD